VTEASDRAGLFDVATAAASELMATGGVDAYKRRLSRVLGHGGERSNSLQEPN
jgi:hypothetical protein